MHAAKIWQRRKVTFSLHLLRKTNIRRIAEWRKFCTCHQKHTTVIQRDIKFSAPATSFVVFFARDRATGISSDTWSILASGMSDPVLWSHETGIWGWKLFQILGYEAPLFAAIDKEPSSGHREDVESSSEGWLFSILFLKSKAKITSALHCFPRNNHKYTYNNQVAK